jgi:hypothetical protein
MNDEPPEPSPTSLVRAIATPLQAMALMLLFVGIWAMARCMLVSP